ncbi:MAG: NADH-quinone oxidoreductase subunit A [Endomicrobiales bacterium]
MYHAIFVFAVLGGLFVLAPFVVSFLIAPKKPGEGKDTTYECGEVPFGSARIQYNVRYYLFALVFLIFDVETVFLYPWAVSLRGIGSLALVEMFIFLAVLLAGLAYAWKKGALEWR